MPGDRLDHRPLPTPSRWSRLVTLAAIFALAFAGAAFAADPDLAGAEQLVRDGRYQEAYDLLKPFEDAKKGDLRFQYLLGRATLGTKQPDAAKAIFERIIAANPDSIAAHLGLGRAYFALGDYARAKIEFETVLRFDELPPDLHQQAEIYAAAADRYEAGERLLPFGYAAIGVGRYRVNATPGTNAFGGGAVNDAFYNARVGGGANYVLGDNYSLDGSLDYRFRYYDNPSRRNDSDLRWNAAVSRAMDENNVLLGVRGRVSYRGDGDYRNDFGLYGSWRYRLDADNQLTFGAEVRQRRYPTGPLRERTRNIAELTAGWVHSLDEGRASVSIVANGGREWATQDRPDGDANFYGVTTTLNLTFTERLGGFLFGFWQRDAYNIERLNIGPDDRVLGISSRTDNLFEVGGGLTWTFARGWSLNPEILWIRDQSNILAINYSSTEAWINLRKDF